jgi:hypothetical protein
MKVSRSRALAQAGRGGKDLRKGSVTGMTATLEVSGGSIVVLGNFAPMTFLPEWFARRGILAESETREARVDVAVPQFVAFELSWIRIEVEINRLMTIVKEGSLIRLHDVVLSVFSLLTETPVSAVGINHFRHYALGSIEQWHKFGDRLAPKEPWGPFATANRTRRAGLRSLLMELARAEHEPAGFTRVRVEPSGTVQNGVFIEINDHYSLREDTKTGYGEAVANLLKDRWSATLKIADEIPRQLLGEVSNE